MAIKPTHLPNDPVRNLNPDKVKTFTEGDSLTNNKSILFNNLWRRLFEIRIKKSRYRIVNESQEPYPITVEFNPEGNLNQQEQIAVDQISEICKVEANVIAEEILKWIKASQLNLEVNIEHYDSNSPALTPQHDFLANNNFPILDGGTSVPKGLKI